MPDTLNVYQSQAENCNKDEQRIFFKVKHENKIKLCSQTVQTADLADLKHRILTSFNYLERDEMGSVISESIPNLKVVSQMELAIRKQKIFEDIKNYDVFLVIEANNDF